MPADIQRNAAFLKNAFDQRGFETVLLTDPANRPLVYAHLASRTPGAKTVLFYIHFDGQPVVPAEWAQKNPFEPVVKRRDASGVWQPVDRDALARQAVRSGASRVRSRGVGRQGAHPDDADGDRSHESHRQVAGGRSQGHPRFGRRNGLTEPCRLSRQRTRHLLRADALVILDGPAHASGRPTLVFGKPRHRDGDARRLRPARAAAQRTLWQLRAESGDGAWRHCSPA